MDVSIGRIRTLNVLHVLNDGFQASIILLLPFIAKEFNASLTSVGFLGSALLSLQIILSLPAGYLALRFGGITLLLLSMLLYSLVYVGISFVPNFMTLIPLFFVAGLGFGLFHPIAFALIAKWSDKRTRGQQMGNFTAIGDVGRIGFAALITSISAIIGWRSASLLYGIVSFTVLVAIMFVLHRKLGTANLSNSEEGMSQVSLPLMRILRNKRFLLATFTGAFDSFASSSLFVFLPFLLLARGIAVSVLGTFSGSFFVGNLLGKYFLGRSVDRFGSVRIFIVAEFLMALFIVLLAKSTNLFFIILFSFILGVLTKGTVPVYQSMVSESVEHHGNYEKSFGLSTFVISIASTLSPVTLGFISDRLGIVWSFQIAAAVALVAILPASAYAYAKRHL